MNRIILILKPKSTVRVEFNFGNYMDPNDQFMNTKCIFEWFPILKLIHQCQGLYAQLMIAYSLWEMHKESFQENEQIKSRKQGKFFMLDNLAKAIHRISKLFETIYCAVQ